MLYIILLHACSTLKFPKAELLKFCSLIVQTRCNLHCGVTVIWIDSVDDSEIFIQDYSVFRADRSRHGGPWCINLC